MIEEEALARVEGGDGGHIFPGEREVEDVYVLLHAFDMCGFWDNDYSALDEPAQCHLSHRFAVFVTDSGQQRIGE